MTDKFLLFFLILILYVILLFVAKYAGWGRKHSCNTCNNCCPDCTFPLNRIKRLYKDKIIHQITLRIFNSKRYICNNCGWEGLRWEKS